MLASLKEKELSLKLKGEEQKNKELELKKKEKELQIRAEEQNRKDVDLKVREDEQRQKELKETSRKALPYAVNIAGRFLNEDGYPAVAPPWGTLNAIDLNKGEILWKVPLGEYEELTAKGYPKTGTENYGGPLISAGNLIFIGATNDGYFRAFNKKTGEELWKYKLPAGGYATPITYKKNGEQYIVIACGGGKMGTPSGNKYVAFSLN